MSTTMKTPGVYIQELDAFGNSVVPVPTAVPAFIGYTEKTSYKGKSLLNKAVRVTSLKDFTDIFGSNPPEVKYNLTAALLPERLVELQECVCLFVCLCVCIYYTNTQTMYTLYMCVYVRVCAWVFNHWYICSSENLVIICLHSFLVFVARVIVQLILHHAPPRKPAL